MQKHVRNYLKHFDIGEEDIWMCELCSKQMPINHGLHIHHIVFRSHGGTDDVKNRCCLCVKCHDKAHNNRKTYVSPDVYWAIHKIFMNNNCKT